MPPLLLTIKQFKINTQQYCWLRSVSTKSIEDKQRYLADMSESPQRPIKLICTFIRCHGVCSNIWALSWFLLSQIYNLRSIKATNLGTFWSVLQTQWRQEINKLLRRSNAFEPYCRLNLLNQPVCYSKSYTAKVTFHFWNKKGIIGATWNITAVLGHMTRHIKYRMERYCITLTILERMRLTCWVLP